jgi:tetratricopeptide (TPR) repeat protein
MAIKNKLKLIIRILLLILLAAGIGLFILFSVRSCRKVERFRDALAAFDSGDYGLARKLLLDTLIEDRNNELAYVKLAEIYHRDGNWPAEVECWSRAIALNPQNKAYPEKLWEALLLSNDYRRIYSEFGMKYRTAGQLPDKELEIYVFSALRTNNSREAEKAWKEATAQNPGLRLQPMGQLISLMLNLDKQTPDEIRAGLEKLSESENPIVAFDALRMLAIYYRFNNGTDRQLEDVLLKGAKLNRFIGEPALGEYYTGKYRFDDAISTYENYLKDHSIIRYALALADLYVYKNEKAKLTELASKFHSGNKVVLMAGYYMDALLAFMDGNTEKLVRIWNSNDDISRSPLAALIALQVNILRDNPDGVAAIAPVFLQTRPFLDFNARAVDMLYRYCQKLISQNKLSAATRLAQLIYDPARPDIFLTRVILQDRLTRNSLDEKALNTALKEFPQDPFLLQLAAEFHYGKNQMQESLKHAARFREVYKEDSPGVDLIEALALEQTGQLDAAFAGLGKLLQKYPDNIGLNNLFLEFCRKHQHRQALELMYQTLSARKEPAVREFLPYIAAEINLLDGKKDEALKLLAEADSNHEQLLLRGAYLLGENDRFKPAVRYYEKLAELSPSLRSLTLINLSEIYKAQNEQEKALRCAFDAWRLDPDNGNVKFCYASRLSENKDYAQLVQVLKLPRFKSKDVDERFLPLWQPAMNEVIKAQFDEKRYEQVLESCRHLQAYFPNSPTARTYIEKVTALQEKK